MAIKTTSFKSRLKGGQFEPDLGGQFAPDRGGQLRPDWGGHIERIFHYTAPRQVMPSTQVPPVQVTKNPVQAMLLQTLLDLTIQETGDLGRLFDLAILNQVSPTSDLTVGGTYYSPLPVNPLKLVVLILQKVHPATGIRDIDLPLGGIGFMQIQNSFIVN